MTIPPLIGCGLAVLALSFYPLYGESIKKVKAALKNIQPE
jgi:hypothetical protein